jgi:CIC family chloride channel protein
MSAADPGARAGQPERAAGWLVMLGLGGVAGLLGATASVVFLMAIGLVQNLLFYGELTSATEPHTHLEPSPWGWGIVAVPALAAFAVTWITRRWSHEARGSGVPEVMYALYYHGGRIPPRVAVSKAVASALSIGSGGSVGREGPIVQMGAVLGSAVATWWNIPAYQRITLVAAGAAAGIAATFNAPIGGLAFAVELLMLSINARTLATVATACAVSTYAGALYAGVGPSLAIPELAGLATDSVNIGVLLACLPLGVLAGGMAAALERGIYWAGDLATALVANDYARHALAMLLVGVMIQLLLVHAGHYYVAGVGYPAITDMVAGVLTDPGFLLLLCAAKLAATALTLGTGASGGVFAPSLFLGAALGAAYGHMLEWLAPAWSLEPVLFAMAGMAGVVGAVTAAVVTAMVMIVEITHSYSDVLPLVLTTAVAYLVRQRITPESVYTLKLVRRGRDTAHGLVHTMSVGLDAAKVMSEDFRAVEREQLPDVFEEASEGRPRYVVVLAGGSVEGVLGIGSNWLRLDPHRPYEGLEPRVMTIPAWMRWPEMMRKMHATGAKVLVVVEPHHASQVLGVITAGEITHGLRETTSAAA